MYLCVCAWLFLALRSILFLFAKAIRKHYLDYNRLELTVWIYGVLGLDFFTKSLPVWAASACPPPAPTEVEPKTFSFWLIVLHTGPPRRRVALTELSQGCHRWLCAKSAASVSASLGDRWDGWKLCSCHSRDSPCGLVGRRMPINGRWQSLPLPSLASAFPGLHLESTGQRHVTWFRWSRVTKYTKSSPVVFHKSLQ